MLFTSKNVEFSDFTQKFFFLQKMVVVLVLVVVVVVVRGGVGGLCPLHSSVYGPGISYLYLYIYFLLVEKYFSLDRKIEYFIIREVLQCPWLK